MKKLILMLMLMAPMTLFAQKFGVVNTTSILQAMPEMAKAQGEINALGKQKENELKALQDELNRKGNEYEKAKPTMNATKQKETETELQTLQQKFETAYNDAQKEIQKKQEELLAPIQTKVANAIEAVGKEGGYTFIFDAGQTRPYLYAGTTVTDLTTKVQTKLK